MKYFYRFLAITLVFFGLTSCSSGYDNPNPAPNPNGITFKAVLNSTNEVPSNSSTATGTATLTLDNVTKKVSIIVTYSGTTATAAHIHNGIPAVSGPIIFALTAGGGGTYPTTYSLSDQSIDATQETDLKANNYYVNIHSATYPNGEIRGQLIKQ
tara:strand:- start:14 stop:478 length:465 start_codon:yes stop_codon:yes gene_type:complete